MTFTKISHRLAFIKPQGRIPHRGNPAPRIAPARGPANDLGGYARQTATDLLSSIFHQPFKQHNRLQSAAQVGDTYYSHPMRKKNYPIFHSLISPAAILPRSSLILPANNSTTVIPPTTPHTPNSLFSAARTHRQFLRSHRPHAAPSQPQAFRFN